MKLQKDTGCGKVSVRVIILSCGHSCLVQNMPVLDINTIKIYIETSLRLVFFQVDLTINHLK